MGWTVLSPLAISPDYFALSLLRVCPVHCQEPGYKGRASRLGETDSGREAHRSWRVVCCGFSRPRPGAFVRTRCAPSRVIFLLRGCWGPKCLCPTSVFLCSTAQQSSPRLEDFNTISLVPGAQQQPVTCDTEPR